MASITAAGIGSGLDIASLVTQLVRAESDPQTSRLNSAQGKTTAQLSAVGILRGALGSLSTALASLKSTGAFSKRTAVSSSTGNLTASAGAGAAPGAHTVVIDQLASAHRLASTGFAASTTTVGTGTLTLASNGKSFALGIASPNDSLASIRDAINAASGNDFVDASIVVASDGAHLVLAARKSGADNALRVTQAGGDGGLAALVYDPGTSTQLVEKAEALDAEILVDGFSHTASTNVVTDVIEGVALNLLGAEPGVERTLTIGRDDAAALAAVQSFVNAYNTVNASISTVTRYDPATRTASALTGDTLPRGIASELRGVIGNVRDNGTLRALGDIGVSFTASGTLALDRTKFDAKLAADPNAIADLFGATDGIATKLAKTIDGITATGGRLDIRDDALNARLDDIDDRRVALERRIDDLTTRYRKQFSALDTLIARMNSTSSFLTQQLASLPTSSG
jgi:flagellar hook-associated protein 2